MIQLKSSREIELMAHGGRILGETLGCSRPAPSRGHDGRARSTGRRFHPEPRGAVPAFKGLYGFPGSVCLSINQEIVHGIPSPKRVLREGDILSIDVGVKYEGYYTDAAVTVPVGAIHAGIGATTRRDAGSAGRGHCGGHAGQSSRRHRRGDLRVVLVRNLSLAKDLVGHGVGLEPHEEPQVPNEGKPKRGTKLVAGAYDRDRANGQSRRRRRRARSPDNWTVVTADGKRSAHFEHTVAITEKAPAS